MDIEKLINWALETDASMHDIEHELRFNGFEIPLFDFLELLESRAAQCLRETP